MSVEQKWLKAILCIMLIMPGRGPLYHLLSGLLLPHGKGKERQSGLIKGSPLGKSPSHTKENIWKTKWETFERLTGELCSDHLLPQPAGDFTVSQLASEPSAKNQNEVKHKLCITMHISISLKQAGCLTTVSPQHMPFCLSIISLPWPQSKSTPLPPRTASVSPWHLQCVLISAYD